ncbi:hypothetical protein, partial [Enterococcus faecium]|uniref:hypothetical protein n=1 Tax=Enterococcus faecium TaxID=1352 RepID=UPI0034E93257
MVTVRDNVQEDLGVRWGFSDASDNGGLSGSLEGAQGIFDAGSYDDIPSIADRLNVNLPVSSAAGSIGMQVAKL